MTKVQVAEALYVLCPVPQMAQSDQTAFKIKFLQHLLDVDRTVHLGGLADVIEAVRGTAKCEGYLSLPR